jgi:hypothetical protein
MFVCFLVFYPPTGKHLDLFADVVSEFKSFSEPHQQPRVLGKRALCPVVLDLPISANLLSALPNLKWFIECYLALLEC